MGWCDVNVKLILGEEGMWRIYMSFSFLVKWKITKPDNFISGEESLSHTTDDHRTDINDDDNWCDTVFNSVFVDATIIIDANFIKIGS